MNAGTIWSGGSGPAEHAESTKTATATTHAADTLTLGSLDSGCRLAVTGGHGQEGVHAMSDDTGSYVVTRRAMSTTTRGVCLAIAVILLVFVVFMWQLPHGAIDFAQRLAFVVIPFVLALVFGGGTVVDFVRGRRAVLEVDSGGIWIRGMPRLAWADVADVRTEEIVSFNGLRTSSGTSLGVGGFEIELGKGGVTPLQEAVNDGEVSARWRLGIVPRDTSILPDEGPLSGASAWAERKSAEAAAQIGRTPIEQAPFGLYATEMDAIFEDVVAEIRKFHEVGALSDLAGINRPSGT